MIEFLQAWVLPELLTILGFLLAMIFLAGILKPRHPPATATAWLLIIILLPYLGVPLFLMFGGRKLRRLARAKARVYRQIPAPIGDDVDSSVERILASYGVPPKSSGNQARLAANGVEAFAETIRLLDRAEYQIHALYYILEEDEVGRAVVERLAARARAGVKVRLLLDAVGSWRLRRRFLAPLVEAGGEVAFFMPMFSLSFRSRANLRNHRKLLVADESSAILGGMNLASEYMGPREDPGRWVDFACVVQGPVVATIADLFRSDWLFATKQKVDRLAQTKAYAIETDSVTTTTTSAQLVASGPDVEGDPLYDALLSAFYRASHRIWVVTPYFVPDESLARAMELAARRGVDVRLIVPEHSNHLMADIARAGYLKQVAGSGAQILLYAPRMIHAKAIVIDQELAVIGSANMDMRSLFLNFEVALFVSSKPFVDQIADWVVRLIPDCKTSIPKPGKLRDLAEGVVRLVAPLL